MPMWLQLIAPVAVSALILVVCPWRWLVRAMAAWLLSPALVYWILIIGELVTKPIVDNALGKSFFGFMLIATVAAIPWLVLCFIGFGIGFVIRRRMEPAVDRTATAPDSVSIRSTQVTPEPELLYRQPTAIAELSARAPFISIEQGAGWREAHIGFANSELRLYGLEVWKEKWRDLRLPPVHLPHPAHPQQTHAYHVHEIGPLDRPVRFAAGELSNGVWGFYVPSPALVESGTSVDGSISFIRDGVRRLDGRDDSSGWIVLTDTSRGHVLADCRSWGFSQVSAQADGSLFLQLQANGFDVLLRIEPAARLYSNLGEAGPKHPLSTLVETLEQSLLAINQHNRVPTYRRISFDGRYRVDLQSVEWSNTHWVNSPRVVENDTGRVVLDLWNTDWDAAVTSFEGNLLRLDMRCYSRPCFVDVELDPGARSFRLTSESRHGSVERSGGLESLPKVLADVSVDNRDAPAPTWPTRSEQTAIPSFAAWRSAVMILVAAMIAIALVALMARNASQPAPQKLDKVPPMQPLQ